MKAKISFTAIVLLVLMTSAATAAIGENINQSISQSASQNIQGSTIIGSSVNQGIAQGASQNAMGTGTNASFASNQNINQNAAQNIQGTNITGSSVSQMIGQGASQNSAGIGNNTGFVSGQNIVQGANQNLQGVSLFNASLNQNIAQSANQSYFVMNNQPSAMTAEQRAALMPGINSFIASYPSNRMFIMPMEDLNAFNAAGRRDVVILNVGSGQIPNRLSSLPIITIPLNQLAERTSEIPLGIAIAVMGTNDMESATAATLLRMQGFNAWAVKTGIC